MEKRYGFGEAVGIESEGADDPRMELGGDESAQNVSPGTEDESEIEGQGECVEMERDTTVEGNLMAVHHRDYALSALPTHRELLHLTGGEEEVGVVEEERGSSDVDCEEGGWVSVQDSNRRIKRQHVRGHPAQIVPSLHVQVPHQHPLQVHTFLYYAVLTPKITFRPNKMHSCPSIHTLSAFSF